MLDALTASPAAAASRSEDRKGPDAARGRDSSADFDRPQQSGDCGAALHQRAHRPPPRRQYAHQAQCVVPIGRRRPGRPPRAAVSAFGFQSRSGISQSLLSLTSESSARDADGPSGPFSIRRRKMTRTGEAARSIALLDFSSQRLHVIVHTGRRRVMKTITPHHHGVRKLLPPRCCCARLITHDRPSRRRRPTSWRISARRSGGRRRRSCRPAPRLPCSRAIRPSRCRTRSV